MKKDPPKLAYDSPEELRDVLRHLSARLGYLNRVAIGESQYVSRLEDLLNAAGELALNLRDKDLRADFGDGWEAGTIPQGEKGARIRALLAEHMRD